MIGLWLPVVLFVGLFAVKRAADKFVTAKIRAGEWDENGPKHETSPPRKYRGGITLADSVSGNEEPGAGVVQLRERDLPGIRDLTRQVLFTLLDGSQPIHDPLRRQAEAAEIDDIFLARGRGEVRLAIPSSLPAGSPPMFGGGAVEIRLEELPYSASAGATVDDGKLSSVLIDGFQVGWPAEATVLDMRLIAPLVPPDDAPGEAP